MRNDLGMAIEHKGAGKYDSESERVAQPAGFAYMAPPGQSNQYGYWEHGSGGNSFWVFYGQYALMRDLLFHGGYHPIDYGEWRDYRTYQQTGRTYYGRDAVNSLPKYGTQGTATADRYSGSSYGKSGGFRNSQFASKSGSYRDSHFATPNAGNPNADHSPKAFRQQQQAIRGPALHAASVRSSAFVPPAECGEKIRKTIALGATAVHFFPKSRRQDLRFASRCDHVGLNRPAIFKPPNDAILRVDNDNLPYPPFLIEPAFTQHARELIGVRKDLDNHLERLRWIGFSLRRNHGDDIWYGLVVRVQMKLNLGCRFKPDVV